MLRSVEHFCSYGMKVNYQITSRPLSQKPDKSKGKRAKIALLSNRYFTRKNGKLVANPDDPIFTKQSEHSKEGSVDARQDGVIYWEAISKCQTAENLKAAVDAGVVSTAGAVGAEKEKLVYFFPQVLLSNKETFKNTKTVTRPKAIDNKTADELDNSIDALLPMGFNVLGGGGFAAGSVNSMFGNLGAGGVGSLMGNGIGALEIMDKQPAFYWGSLQQVLHVFLWCCWTSTFPK